MIQSRRDFLKVLGGSAGTILLYGATNSKEVVADSSTPLPESTGKTMLYDALKCVGCRACQNACKEWNELLPESIGYRGIYDNPPDLSVRTWTLIKAREYTFGGRPALLLCKYQCMHCTEASCESVCPTGAISHQGAAIIIDQKICIGCGYCVQACPFNVPHKGHGIDAGAVKKCTFCIDRLAEGLPPACVEACPAEAMQFGQRADLITHAKARVEGLRRDGYSNATFYGESELGGLHVLYVLAERPSIYGLPQTPLLATSKTAVQWFSGIITAGVIAAVPFWLLFRRKKKMNELTTQVSSESGKER